MAQKKSQQTVEDSIKLAQESESGSRVLSGKTGFFIYWFAIIMSVFQLYTGFFGELPGYKQLSVHLFFAMVLCFVYFPRSKKSPRNRMTVPDVILAILGGATAIYVFVNYEHWVNAQGDAALYDILIGGGPAGPYTGSDPAQRVTDASGNNHAVSGLRLYRPIYPWRIGPQGLSSWAYYRSYLHVG